MGSENQLESMKRGKRPYIIRVVIPKRDYRRLEWFFRNAEALGLKRLAFGSQVLFEKRRDLDVLEAVYIARLEERARRRLEKQLAISLSGSIGFFIIHGVKEAWEQ